MNKQKIKVSILAISLIVSLLLVELILNRINYQTYQFSRQGHLDLINNNSSSYVFDMHSLYKPKPESTLYNQLGIRQTLPEKNSVKNNNKQIKILLIGDSFTYGSFVGNDETYPAQLSKLIKDENVVVFNGGVPGYGSDQSYYYLTKFLIPKISPNIIIWNFHPSDLEDNKTAPSFKLERKQLKQQLIVGRYLTLKFLFDSLPLPKSIKKSKTANILFSRLKTLQTRDEYLSNPKFAQYSRDKLTKQIEVLERFAKKENIELYYTLMPTLTLLNNNSSDEEIINYKILNNVLEKFPKFIDFNNEIKLMSFDQQDKEKQYQNLFTNDIDEPGTEDRWRHLNDLGNKMLAIIINNKLNLYY